MTHPPQTTSFFHLPEYLAPARPRLLGSIDQLEIYLGTEIADTVLSSARLSLNDHIEIASTSTSTSNPICYSRWTIHPDLLHTIPYIRNHTSLLQ